MCIRRRTRVQSHPSLDIGLTVTIIQRFRFKKGIAQATRRGDYEMQLHWTTYDPTTTLRGELHCY